MEKEIKSLSESKEDLENLLESLNLPTEVNTENLALREGRRGIDLVNDEVEAELNKVISMYCYNTSKTLISHQCVGSNYIGVIIISNFVDISWIN